MALQKPARGLSDVLGLFQGGEVPLEVAGVVNPTIDAEKFLLERRSFRRTFTGAGIQFLTLDLEQGFRYQVHWIGLRMDSVTVPGQIFAVAPAVADGIKIMGLDNQAPITFTANGIYSLGFNCDNIIVGPDLDVQKIGYSIGGSTAAVTYDFFANYVRWKI